MRYRLVEGLLVEPMSHLWAAFSPVTGETVLLNDESAAILELLAAGPAGTVALCRVLAADCGLSATELQPLVEQGWQRLVEAGLVQLCSTP